MPFTPPKIDIHLHEALNKAIEQWVDLTGVDPEAETWRYSFGDMNIPSTYEQFNEAQKLDPSGLTAAMLLRSFVQQMATETTFEAREILEEPEKVDETITKMRAMVKTLEAPAIARPTADFVQWLKAGAVHYNVDDAEALFEDPYELAYLRRDALQAIEKLEVHQFLYGDPCHDEIKYADSVFQFWNVNSLVKAMTAMPSGVTLSLIRDPEASFSYFVFGIRNGGNLYVLTDKPTWAHPKEKHMTRRPGRHLERRIFQYHFPYQLMEYEFDEKGKVHVPKQEGLVLYNQKAIVLGKLIELEPQQILWLIMVLALIYERYWKEGKQLPAQSYTGVMIAIPDALTKVARHLPAKLDGKLEFQRLTVGDTDTEKLVEEGQWNDNTPTRHNQWLDDRYGHDVPEDYLNLLYRTDLPELPTCWDQGHYLHRATHQLDGLEPVEFGTVEQLQRDAKWFARYNKACYVNAQALKEFDEKKVEVVAWYHERVEANLDPLLESVVRLDFQGRRQGTPPKPEGAGEHWHSFDQSYEYPANILDVRYDPRGWPPMYWSFPTYSRDTLNFGTWNKKRQQAHCYLSGARASIFARIAPQTPFCLSRIVACEIDELPVFLQHYFAQDPYGGNPILDRLDPMDWVVHNPWKTLDLDIIVTLSKRGFNRLRKKHGLEIFRKDDWQTIKPAREDD